MQDLFKTLTKTRVRTLFVALRKRQKRGSATLPKMGLVLRITLLFISIFLLLNVYV